MKIKIMRNVAIFAVLSMICGSMLAQEPPSSAPATESAETISPEEAEFRELMSKIAWEKGDAGKVGTLGTLKIPEGYLYTGKQGTITLMEAYGNLTNGMELGYISPESFDWFAVFEFDECGYVKDDEKDALDADKIMEQMIKGQKEANKQLVKLGRPTLEVTGWHTRPFYNTETKNLEWAIRLRNEGGGETINYKTKILGRRGVMDVVLVCDESQLSAVIPEFQKLLAGYEYLNDQSYAAYTKGDRVSEYGLTGLIVGGGLLAAAKTGYLAKFWKLIVAGVVVVGGFIKRLFSRKSEA